MSTEEKILRMFLIVHGTLSHSCSLKTVRDEYECITYIHVMKDNNIAWSVSLSELLFDYQTRNWEL